MQGFVLITNFKSRVSTLLQAIMAQRVKQMEVNARDGFAHHPVKLVLLPNSNMYEADS
jgi:hypothetical protein